MKSAASVPAAVHAPPWRVKDDEFDVSIIGKSGPGWYDSVAEDVSNRETADFIVQAVNERAALLEIVQEFTEHGSWRCQYRTRYGKCCCGLDERLAALGLPPCEFHDPEAKTDATA